MAKRPGDFTHNISVKKRKGIKVRTVNILDLDDEGPTLNVNTEYVRLLKTRATTSGKADSITMNTFLLFEVDNTPHSDLPDPTPDGREEAVVEVEVPNMPAKKRRKKKNDSVCSSIC